MWPQRTNMSNQVLSETWIWLKILRCVRECEVETLQTQLAEANKLGKGGILCLWHGLAIDIFMATWCSDMATMHAFVFLNEFDAFGGWIFLMQLGGFCVQHHWIWRKCTSQIGFCMILFWSNPASYPSLSFHSFSILFAIVDSEVQPRTLVNYRPRST